MSKVYSDIYRRVYDDAEGALEVGPCVEVPGCVSVRTADDRSKAYFGPIDLTLQCDLARALGQALLRAADEVELEAGW